MLTSRTRGSRPASHPRAHRTSGCGGRFTLVAERLEPRTLLATFTVINTANSGAGSLSQAITTANNTPGFDSIVFNIPGPGVKTIRSGMPSINESAMIDGYTQPGASANTLSTGSNAVLLIEISGASTANTGINGLNVSGDAVTIRGLVINGFKESLTGSGEGYGIAVSGVNCVLEGNFFGTDVTGTAPLPNEGGGIEVDQFGDGARIGGTTPAARNLISGNKKRGVIVSGAENVIVQGNLIGTDATGAAALPNANDGIALFGGVGCTIGGTAAGTSNLIFYNGHAGVAVADPTASANRVQGNRIFANGDLGIDLGRDGVTPNDPVPDADAGPNGLQNAPVLISASTNTTSTSVSGTLDGPPNTPFSIDLFASPAADASGFGEGAFFLGAVQTTTGPTGLGFFQPTTLPPTVPGWVITATATATNAGGATSEFSAAITIPPLPDFSWDGRLPGGGVTTNGLWNNATNWAGDVAPTAGAPLVFAAGALRTVNSNNFPALTPFDSIEFRGDGYQLSGNAVALSDGVVSNAATGDNVLNLPVDLLADQRFFARIDGTSLAFNNLVSLHGVELLLAGNGDVHLNGGLAAGGGSLVKGDSGTATIAAAGFSGRLNDGTLNGGTLVVNADLGTTGTFTLAGGTLAGTGRVAQIASSGSAAKTIAPGPVGGGTGTLRTGNAFLSPSITLSLDINSATSFDQFAPDAFVDLGNAALNVTLGGGFVPAVGQFFTILDNTGTRTLSGTFAGLPEGAVFFSGGVQFRINYLVGSNGNDVVITRVAVPPALSAITVGNGSAQRSQVKSLTIAFDQPVNLAVGALKLERLNTAGSGSGTNDRAPPTDASAVMGVPASTDGGRTWVVSFVAGGPFMQTSGATPTGSLVDGIYQVSVDPTKVTAGGMQMAAPASLKFHRLFGDTNGNQTTNNADLALFRNTFLKTSADAAFNPALDFDNNGVVNNLDFGQFRGRFLKAFEY